MLQQVRQEVQGRQLRTRLLEGRKAGRQKSQHAQAGLLACGEAPAGATCDKQSKLQKQRCNDKQTNLEKGFSRRLFVKRCAVGTKWNGMRRLIWTERMFRSWACSNMDPQLDGVNAMDMSSSKPSP